MASPAAKNLLLQCMAKLPPLKRLGASLVVRSGNNTPEIHAVSDPYLSSARPFPNLAGGDCAKDVGAMIYFCSSASGLKTPVIEEGGGLPSVCLPIPLISMDGARAEFEVRPSEERRTAGAKRQLSTGPPSHKTCYLQSVASLLASPMIPTPFAIHFALRRRRKGRGGGLGPTVAEGGRNTTASSSSAFFLSSGRLGRFLTTSTSSFSLVPQPAYCSCLSTAFSLSPPRHHSFGTDSTGTD